MAKVVEFYATGHVKVTDFTQPEAALAYALSLPHASQPGEWGFILTTSETRRRENEYGRLLASIDITPAGCVPSTAEVYE